MRIRVDFEISPRAKRALKIAAAGAVVLGGSVAIAGVPNTFKSGDSLSAQTMNDNFTSLDQRIAKLEALAAKETADGGYTVGAYCGSSTSTTAGDMSGLSVTGTGYAKARSQCQLTCSSSSAHMCTAGELARTAALAIPMSSQGWASSGEATGNGNYECLGWTTASNTYDATIWNNVPIGPSIVDCSKLYPVLCCD